MPSDVERECTDGEHFWPTAYVDGDTCNCGRLYLDATTKGAPKVIESDAALNTIHALLTNCEEMRASQEAAEARAATAEARMREFCGWLSGDIEELHSVEVPRLAESLDRFLERVDAKS